MTTSRGSGGLLNSDNIGAKSRKPMVDVLRDKHTAMQIPDADAEGDMAFEPYPAVPGPLPLDSSEAVTAQIAKQLSGRVGPDSIDSRDLSKMLLYHKKASRALREELAAWVVEWLANNRPPWAAYRATKNCRLAALDKRSGVRPVGIALIWDRMVCKLVLSSTGLNTRMACGSKQLYAGLEARIESAVQAMLQQSTSNGGMKFTEEEGNPTAQELPAATADDDAAVGPDTEF